MVCIKAYCRNIADGAIFQLPGDYGIQYEEMDEGEEGRNNQVNYKFIINQII